ncbi:histidine phosphatase family protein [Phyllobacterium phragmitis]|uniref:Histidine phosphatase family protein n=1 Tax=Phyllobacterium phragmitis TaxID=2670329 RepID=A0A2S9IVD4_9HYPH|nr:histidine phosphatase family protein [Phyllobacterium phragmitis]PRD44492.1 histidine phosphatase family protein [Phyllobacterium phragmitis]
MRFYYITHPQIVMDPAIPVPQWGLSQTGRARLEAICDRPWVLSLTRIFSSDEKKALETAEILARGSGCPIEIDAMMGENDRASTGFLPPPEFEKAADRFFAEPELSFNGWERAVDAQARIVQAVETAIDHSSGNEPVAFVGHGGVGTLLKHHLGRTPISRIRDQPPGGGNIFAFRLSDRALLCDWEPLETFSGDFHE